MRSRQTRLNLLASHPKNGSEMFKTKFKLREQLTDRHKKYRLIVKVPSALFKDVFKVIKKVVRPSLPSKPQMKMRKAI